MFRNCTKRMICDCKRDWLQWLWIWLFLNFPLPSPAVVEILQFLIAITILIHLPLAIQTVRMICGMIRFSIMLEHFERWSGHKFVVACKAKKIFLWAFFTESRMHCVYMLTGFVVSCCHFWMVYASWILDLWQFFNVIFSQFYIKQLYFTLFTQNVGTKMSSFSPEQGTCSKYKQFMSKSLPTTIDHCNCSSIHVFSCFRIPHLWRIGYFV